MSVFSADFLPLKPCANGSVRTSVDGDGDDRVLVDAAALRRQLGLELRRHARANRGSATLQALTAGWCAVAGASTPGISAPWLCTYAVTGCGQPDADNYLSHVTVSVLSTCQYGGCNDAEAKNFDPKVKLHPPQRLPALASPRVTKCAGDVQ